MKKWSRTATGGLVLSFMITGIYALWNFEYFTLLLQLIYGAFYLYLVLFLFKISRKTLANLKKQKKDTMSQRVQQTLESAKLPDTPEPNSILYLRPFKVDNQYMSEIEYGGKKYNSVESVICQMVKEAGSPVAIGKPGEDVQPLGAHRVYATDDTWKDKVSSFFQVSKCVILYADFTPGVTWEIENSLANYKHKLILIPKVYNQHEAFFHKAAMVDPFFLLYPFYSLWANHFFSKKGHRGKAYYKNWNRLMKQHMPNVKMNDKVSAVIFENGKAVPFYAAKPNQEEQLNAIHRAINAKLQIPVPQPVYIAKKEKPLLRLCADLGFKSVEYAELYPFTFGHIEFYEQGLRYKSPLRLFRFNIRIKDQYRTIYKYKKSQLIPYSAIQELRFVADNNLQLILQETNGSLYISVPIYHQECIPKLHDFLALCAAQQRFCRGYHISLEQSYLQQVADYTKGLYQIEAASFLLGIILLILSYLNVRSAYIALIVLSAPWNISLAMISALYSRNGRKRTTRFWGICFAVLHMFLYVVFMEFIS